MHGLGNDFIIIDERDKPDRQGHVSRPERVAQLSHRHTGIGCDQFLVLQQSEAAGCYMQIYNADGSEAGTCGNATRCVAWLLMREQSAQSVSIETMAGVLECTQAGDQICVNMGQPKCDWRAIPLSKEMDTLYVAHDAPLLDGVAVNMGNPHLVIFVRDIQQVALSEIGAQLETSPLFPERVNVNVAQILSPSHFAMRTWERGAGETLACGSGACATMVAARRRGLSNEQATLSLPGGDLVIAWQGNDDDQAHPVMMTGDVAYVFEGVLPEGAWL